MADIADAETKAKRTEEIELSVFKAAQAEKGNHFKSTTAEADDVACKRFKVGKENLFTSAVPTFDTACGELKKDIATTIDSFKKHFGDSFERSGTLQKEAARGPLFHNLPVG